MDEKIIIYNSNLTEYNEIANTEPTKLYNLVDTLLGLKKCKQGDMRDAIISKILNSGYKLTEKNIIQIVSNQINRSYLLEKIVFTERNIEIISEYCCWFAFEYLFDRKYLPTSNIFKLLLENKHSRNNDMIECIKICINYGYIIDYDDFLGLTRNKINITWCTISNDFLTDEFSQICESIGFYPKYFNVTQQYLINKSKTLWNINNVIEFENIISTTNLYPNTDCLINACINGSINSIKLLIEKYKVKPTNKCLIAVLSNSKKQQTYLINKYIECHPDII
jgi:hypothetical protein